MYEGKWWSLYGVSALGFYRLWLDELGGWSRLRFIIPGTTAGLIDIGPSDTGG